MENNTILVAVKELPKVLNMKTVSSGVVAAVFGCTGPALIILGGASAGGLTHAQTISWLFSVYFFGGIIGIYLSLKYRQPIAGAYTIAGAVLVASSLTQFTLSEAVGAYMISGLFVFLLGVSGIVGKILKRVPIPIIMGMIVGIMIKFSTDMILSIKVSPILAGSAVVSFVLSMKFIKKFPPVLTALIVAITIAVFTKQFHIQDVDIRFITPQIVMPSFNVKAIISISIPLAIIVICTENAQAAGVLLLEKYKPPINAMTIISGIGSMIAALFGGHSINIAGPMTAICASEESGEKDGRYAAAFLNGTMFTMFGLFSSLVVPFVSVIPIVIVSNIAGLALMGVLLNALKMAFSDTKFQLGAFFALVIAMSGFTLFDISSPFWAIIGSLLVSYILEKEHFKLGIAESES